MAAAGGGRCSPYSGELEAGRAEEAEQFVFALQIVQRAVRRVSNIRVRCRNSQLDGFYSVLAFAASVGDAPRVKLTFFQRGLLLAPLLEMLLRPSTLFP